MVSFERRDVFVESCTNLLWLFYAVDHNGGNTKAETSLGESREGSWYDANGIAKRLPGDAQRRSVVLTGSDRLARAEDALRRQLRLRSKMGEQSVWDEYSEYFRAAFTGGRLLVALEGDRRCTTSVRGAVVLWRPGSVEVRLIVSPLSIDHGTTEVLRRCRDGVYWTAIERYSGCPLGIARITIE